MPFEIGMDTYLKSFAPVPLTQRLRLRTPAVDLREVSRKVAKWYGLDPAVTKADDESDDKNDAEREQPSKSSETVRVANRVDYAFGNYYDGEWQDGERHGQGEYLCKTKGYLYRGEWNKGIWDGQGRMFTRKKDDTWFLVYVGNYKKGQRDGWGTCRWSEDEFFEGLWVKDKRMGWGRHFAPDGDIYEGQWLDDKRSGQGTTRESFGNHHFGEYFNDKKHGPGKYFYTKTGKCFEGTWKNDIPVLGQIIQLQRSKPTFPHQYPMPELYLKKPDAVLSSSLQDSCKLEPDLPYGEKPEWKSLCKKKKVLDSSRAALETLKNRQETMDMRKILTEIEPDICEVNDPSLAAQVGDYLLAIEYIWRSNQDQWGPRPKRVRKLLAQNSQEFKKIEEQPDV